MHEELDNEIGVITLDSSFSPIRKVAYAVEQARVGQMTNYDKLIIEVWTDGSISPGRRACLQREDPEGTADRLH